MAMKLYLCMLNMSSSIPQSGQCIWEYCKSCHNHIMKTCSYNFAPLKNHFYIIKLGFAGVYIIFLISAQSIDCGYALELPHLIEAVLKIPTIYALSRNMKNIRISLSGNFHVLVVKCSVYLNRHVFTMVVPNGKYQLIYDYLDVIISCVIYNSKCQWKYSSTGKRCHYKLY